MNNTANKDISCTEYSRQLIHMADAQNKILNSMVKKNDSLAETLDGYADDFDNQKKQVKQADLVSLRSSADSFRHHSVREHKLVQEFNQKTLSLIEKINMCLKQKNESSILQKQAQLDRRSGDTTKN